LVVVTCKEMNVRIRLSWRDDASWLLHLVINVEVDQLRHHVTSIAAVFVRYHMTNVISYVLV